MMIKPIELYTCIVICSVQLLDSECSHSRIHRSRTEQFQCVVSVNFCPLRQQFFYCLFHLRWITPRHRMDELGKTSLVACKVKAEFPYKILLLGIERLAGSVIEDFTNAITNLGIWFKFSVIWAASVAPNESPVFILYRVLSSDVGINNAPEMMRVMCG